MQHPTTRILYALYLLILVALSVCGYSQQVLLIHNPNAEQMVYESSCRTDTILPLNGMFVLPIHCDNIYNISILECNGDTTGFCFSKIEYKQLYCF
jgi:hypothetical protein